MADYPVVVDLRSTLPFEPGTTAPRAKRARKTIYALPDNEWLIANSVTVEKVEWRILRAFNTIKATPDHERRFMRGMKAAWPQFMLETEDLDDKWNDKDERADFERKAVKFRPTPRDESDCLTALEWLRGVPVFDFSDGFEIPRVTYRDPLSKSQIRILQYRAAGYGSTFIAERMKTIRQDINRKYRATIQGLFHAAVQHALEGARRATLRSIDISGPSLKDDLNAARNIAGKASLGGPAVGAGGLGEGSGEACGDTRHLRV